MSNPIWFRDDITLEKIDSRGKETMVEHLAIRFTEIGDDFLCATMPVDQRTKQPVGLLHGGASVALAETVASTAANMTVDGSQEYCVGLEINANHISSCTSGEVIATARPFHLGKTTQVWNIEIKQGDRLVCVSRMTAAILKKRK
jgi:1,4-dihydroxy-2-naphthoyl-CoA hydrolase